MDKPNPIVTHIGLGDCIVQTGLAVALLERYERIAFPCYEPYLASVSSFFVNHPRISVYTLPHRPGWNWGSPPDRVWDETMERLGLDTTNQIRLGNYSGRGTGWDFTQSFYEHAQVPYEARWDKCPIREAAKGFADHGCGAKVFIHDDPQRGFNIRRNGILDACVAGRETIGSSMLTYAETIESADEVHVIDSSFFWLVNALNPKGKLYLHCYARWPRPNYFRYQSRQEWEYLF
jgi:hypothetical protein